MNGHANTASLAHNVPMNTLTAADRCDRCGAQAYVRATLPSTNVLLFCAHHWRDHRAAVEAVATVIHDETPKLTASTG